MTDRRVRLSIETMSVRYWSRELTIEEYRWSQAGICMVYTALAPAIDIFF